LSAERLVLFQASQVIQVAPVELQDSVSDLFEDRLHSERLAARLCAQRMDDEQWRSEIETCFEPKCPGLLAEGKRLGDHRPGLQIPFPDLHRIRECLPHPSSSHNLFGHSYRVLVHDKDRATTTSMLTAASCARTSRLIEALLDQGPGAGGRGRSASISSSSYRQGVRGSDPGRPRGRDEHLAVRTLDTTAPACRRIEMQVQLSGSSFE
jgi:hypothetical protein